MRGSSSGWGIPWGGRASGTGDDGASGLIAGVEVGHRVVVNELPTKVTQQERRTTR